MIPENQKSRLAIQMHAAILSELEDLDRNESVSGAYEYVNRCVSGASWPVRVGVAATLFVTYLGSGLLGVTKFGNSSRELRTSRSKRVWHGLPTIPPLAQGKQVIRGLTIVYSSSQSGAR